MQLTLISALASHILLVASILCVMPECVIHSTCMGTRDLGFSLTDNWCVICDPLLVAHLYCLDLRSPTSPHCLATSRYIPMTDVWPLLAPWRTCFARYWLALLVGPAYEAPTLLVVSQRPGTGRYKLVFENPFRSNNVHLICLGKHKPHIITSKLIQLFMHNFHLFFIFKSFFNRLWFNLRDKSSVPAEVWEKVMCRNTFLYLPNDVLH